MLREQAWAFVVTIFAGTISAASFNVYQMFRRMLGLKKTGTVIGDFLSLVIISLGVFYLLLLANWAEARLFVGLGFIIGVVIYLIIVYPLLLRVYEHCKTAVFNLRKPKK